MAADPIEFSPMSSLRINVDDSGGDRVVIQCHGRLISETSGDLNRVAKPILGRGKHIALDLRDVSDMDSCGLGAVIALEASALRQGLCSVELCGAGVPVMDLLRTTNTLSAFDWTGEEIAHHSVLELRVKRRGEELRRNPDSKFGD